MTSIESGASVRHRHYKLEDFFPRLFQLSLLVEESLPHNKAGPHLNIGASFFVKEAPKHLLEVLP